MISSFIAWLTQHGDLVQGFQALLAILAIGGGIAFFPVRSYLKRHEKPAAVTIANPEAFIAATPAPKGIHMDAETFADFHRNLLSQALADRSATHGEELKRLDEKIDALNARLADPDRALAEQQAIIVSLEEKLARQGNQLGGDATAEAKTALEAGDFTKARALFETLAAQTEPDIQTHADAAYALGQIAEAEIRWQDAATHYATAARLTPTFDTLRKAREFAWRAGNYPAAFRFGEDLLAWSKSQGSQEQLAVALSAHAMTLHYQGNDPDSEALYLQALEIGKATFGTAHPNYAIHLNNLAGVLQAQGCYAEAEVLCRDALKIAKATVGTAHPDYATRLNNLAGVVQAQGRYDEAEVLFREALEIDKATIGTAHPDYAIRLNNLAGVVQDHGRYAEAEALYCEALKIAKATVGTAHPDYANNLNNIAELARAQGRYVEAEALYRETLKIDKATVGTAHPGYAIHLNNLAWVVQAQGRIAEARGLYAQALGILREKLKDGHPNTGIVAKHLLSLLQTHFSDDPEIPALQSLLTPKP